MKKKGLLLCHAGLFLCVLLCPAPSSASSSTVRCGKGFVSAGDTKAEARQKCGKPASTDKSTIPKSRSRTGKSIKVEEWTYNFGADRFMKRLRFENGKLKSIESLGRGN